MRGVIPLLPNTCLHGINRNNFTFTGTLLFAPSPYLESTQLSTLSVLWDFSQTEVKIPITVYIYHMHSNSTYKIEVAL
jgi:hypothetical protein